MTVDRLVVKIIETLVVIIFIIFEGYSLLTVSSADINWMFIHDPDRLYIFVLRSLLLFVALPAVTIFKLLDYFDLTPESEYHVFATAIFYRAIYFSICILIVLRLLDGIL